MNLRPTRLLAALAWTSFISVAARPAGAVVPPGPDAFGHTIASIPLNLRDIRVSGDNIGLDDADDEVAVVSIGFNFSFYGLSYSQVEVSSNGFLSFNLTGDAACCSGDPIPTPGGDIDNFVAGYWEDLDAGEGGIIRADTLGAPGSRQFIVGFYDVSDNDDPVNSINTFEMILHETSNNIELQYDQVQFEDIDSKSAGIENFDGTDGIELLFISSSAPLSNGDLLFDQEGFLITRVPEPSSIALLAAFAAAGLRRRRRDR
jgi:hypothetical protein